MCGQHRADTISEIKQRLQDGKPVRVISTQLVEAGVDLDFPVVLPRYGRARLHRPGSGALQPGGKTGRWKGKGERPCIHTTQQQFRVDCQGSGCRPGSTEWTSRRSAQALPHSAVLHPLLQPALVPTRKPSISYSPPTATLVSTSEPSPKGFRLIDDGLSSAGICGLR